METEYIYVVIGVISLVVGMFFGIQTVKFFSEEIIYKLEKALDNQLEFHEAHLHASVEQIIDTVDRKVDFIDQINKVLKNTQTFLSKNNQQIENLNANCYKRAEYESEIIKLKKIIQRQEKKR